MYKSTTEITNAVRVAINETANNESDSAIVTVDDSEMDTLIESKIEESIDFVHGNAPVNLLAEDTISRKSIPATDNSITVTGKVQTVVLDNTVSYLRIIGAKLSSWNGYVKDIIDDTDYNACARARAKYSGATHQRPAIILNRDNNSTKTFELHKASTSSKETCTFLYVGRAIKMKDSSNSWYVDERLYHCIISYCAGLVLLTYNEKDKAQEQIELAMTNMGINTAALTNNNR